MLNHNWVNKMVYIILLISSSITVIVQGIASFAVKSCYLENVPSYSLFTPNGLFKHCNQFDWIVGTHKSAHRINLGKYIYHFPKNLQQHIVLRLIDLFSGVCSDNPFKLEDVFVMPVFCFCFQQQKVIMQYTRRLILILILFSNPRGRVGGIENKLGINIKSAVM